MDVKSVNVIQESVPSLCDDRKRPQRHGAASFGCLTHLPFDDGISDQPHAVRVRDGKRAFREARFFDPGGAGHLAVSVLRVVSGKYRRWVVSAAGMDGGNSGPNWSGALL